MSEVEQVALCLFLGLLALSFSDIILWDVSLASVFTMVATLLAQGMVPAVAAACAVWVHGRAGDLAMGEGGMAGLLAGDIVEKVPNALNSINR